MRILPLILLLGCGPAAQPQTQTPTPPAEAPTPIVVKPVQASGARSMEPEAPQPLVIPRAQLDRVLAGGPGRLLQHVPLEPMFAAGHKFAGFRIVSLWDDDPRVLRYGVMPGDILVALGGQRIVTPDDLMKAFVKLRTADELQVDVQRGGQPRTFRFPIVPPNPP